MPLVGTRYTNVTQLIALAHRGLSRTARISTSFAKISPSNYRMASSDSTVKAASRLLANEPDWEPPFIYGTAWKKEKTKELVIQAVAEGFRKVDTAAQPRHYQEPLVGEALREAYDKGIVKRGDIYLQTKYTTPAGQDLNNMPYDYSAPLEEQIHVSVASSLDNLRPLNDSQDNSYVDCLLLHSPLPTIQQTIQAWNILETYVPGKIRTLGISNVTLPILEAIHQTATVKPSVVQNRFYPQTRYDVPLRAFCSKHDITYESFWTLTGNPRLLKSNPVAMLAQSTGTDLSTALYALVMDQGIVVLNGTTSTAHMKEDLAKIRRIREWGLSHTAEWASISEAFGRCISA